MSSQKGNSTRSRGQKHQNTFAFRNDKYGATVQVKKAKSKTHDGLCQRCKEVLEWKVKYSKYKSLTQPRKCVKCSQKAVKDAYHVICKPCSLQQEICCKCGKKEDIVIPVNTQVDEEEKEEVGEPKMEGLGRGKKDVDGLDSDDDFDDDDDLSVREDDDDAEGGDIVHDTEPKKADNNCDVLPAVSQMNVKE